MIEKFEKKLKDSIMIIPIPADTNTWPGTLGLTSSTVYGLTWYDEIPWANETDRRRRDWWEEFDKAQGA
jgi:hypothetical protein